jgi:radical SAM protein (TIGR01212 family)
MQPASPPLPQGPFPGGNRYNSYGAFLKEKFGCRVSKIVVDAGFSCPNRDGTIGVGGCSYCNNDAFRPATAQRPDPIPLQVEKGIAFLRRRYRAQKFVVYFQTFSNTFAPLDQLIPMYESAISFPDVVGIAVGTRPDCIDEAKIAAFARLAQTHFVTLEYGLESIHDSTLARINRGHDYECWLRAVRQTRGRGIHIGAHLILGFPWESRGQMLAMAGAVSDAGLDFLKLHHLHVVRNTALGSEFLSRPFPLLEYEEYVGLVVDFLELLHPAIRIERLFGIAPEEHLIGPHWGKTKAVIQHDIEQALAARQTWQGRHYRAYAIDGSDRRH